MQRERNLQVVRACVGVREKKAVLYSKLVVRPIVWTVGVAAAYDWPLARRAQLVLMDRAIITLATVTLVQRV